MSTAKPNTRLPGLLKQLIERRHLTESKATIIMESARKNKISIMAQLIRERSAPFSELAQVASQEYSLGYVDLDSVNISPMMLNILDDEQKRKLQLLPIHRIGKKLLVAISDPAHLPNLDDVKFATKLSPEAVIVDHNKLSGYLEAGGENIIAGNASASQSSGMSVSNEAFNGGIAIDTQDLRDQEEQGDDIEIVSFVDKLLAHAISSKVSDIHIEPYEKNLRVRYRIDGILQVVATPPIGISAQLVARLKVLARMDMAERRIPQDGRIRFNLENGKAIDFRINTLPTVYGEKVVMRILDNSPDVLNIEKLGFSEKQKTDLMNALGTPDGMILVTGPTGSGKTVTLYTCLGILNTSERNISTAEDPAEINMPGVNQVNVNPKVGLTFAEALRAFLRQDPDIIMVGEIRDLETAEISIKAAQTGHLVLSTLHTNSAPETLTRLMNMGVPPFNIASSVNLIVAQRLARRLCEKCKAPAPENHIPRESLIEMGFKAEELDNLVLYEAKGCAACSNGYKGRVGVYQVMPMSEKMGRMVMNGSNSIDIADQALKEGVADLRESGLNKVREGVTTLAEVERITKD